MRRCRILFLIAGLAVLTSYMLYSYNSGVLPQAAFYLLKDVPVPQTADRILVFCPHPDDETIAVGGYIYSACRAGAVVRIVLVTDGNKHGLRDRRYQEFHRATALLGVSPGELRFWGYPDGKLRLHSKALVERVEGEWNDFRPTVVFYPHPADHHPDHAILGKVLEEVVPGPVNSGSPVIAYRYLVHHNRYPQHGLFARRDKLLPPVAILSFDQQWQKFCLSPAAMSVKRAAIKEYRTQLRNPFLRPLLLGLNRDNEIMARRVP